VASDGACALNSRDRVEVASVVSILPSLQPGGLFADRYRVTGVIKSGGMGAVYEVEDTKTASPRALKIMHPDLVGDPELRARFEQEARVTGGVESEHVVRTFDAGVEAASGTPFIVMELLRGEELGVKLKNHGALPVEEALSYLAQAARALDKTHAAGIVHRDLKPENLFLTTRDDGSGCLKILDFGVAKVLTEGTGKTTKALGTPLYMPLEQIQGSRDIGPEADRYALAHIAYAMIVGEPYWREESRDVGLVALCMKVAKGIDEAATVRALRRCKTELPAGFDAWFARAVATSPSDRYPSSVEMIAELDRALTGREVIRGPSSRGDRVNTPLTLTALESSPKHALAATLNELPSPASATPRRTAPTVAMIAVAAVVLGGTSAFFLRGTPASEPVPVSLPARAGSATEPAGAAADPVPSSAATAASALVVEPAAPPSSSASAAASGRAAASARAVGSPADRGGAKAPVPRPSAAASSFSKWSIY
jgi:eukaryotic-like serine/threonine-protein kinase